MRNIFLLLIVLVAGYFLLNPEQLLNATKKQDAKCDMMFTRLNAPYYSEDVAVNALVGDAETFMRMNTDTTKYTICDLEDKVELRSLHVSPAMSCVFDKQSQNSYCIEK